VIVRPHFALFDALRGIAVVAVVLFHVASLTGALGVGAFGRTATVLGGEAVIVFFVISGFLLYRPFAAARVAGAEMPSLRRFGRRRVGRIVPAYWVALTALAVFPGIVGVFTGEFWRYYGFLQLYSPETIGKGIPVAWTLCVEVTFYAALPLWVLAMRRASVRTDLLGLAALALCGAAIDVLAARRLVPTELANALPGQLTWLTLGMALALWTVTGPEPRWVVRRPELCWAASIVALAGLAAISPSGGLRGLVVALNQPQPLSHAVAKVVLSIVLAAGFVLPAAFGERAGGVPRRVLAWAPVAFLGTVSYSLYLYHLTIAELLALEQDPAHFSARGLGLVGHLGPAPTPVLLAPTLAMSATVAAVSYRWVERPFFKGRGRPATVAGPAPRRA